jgi:hypothetical protein
VFLYVCMSACMYVCMSVFKVLMCLCECTVQECSASQRHGLVL